MPSDGKAVVLPREGDGAVDGAVAVEKFGCALHWCKHLLLLMLFGNRHLAVIYSLVLLLLLFMLTDDTGGEFPRKRLREGRLF